MADAREPWWIIAGAAAALYGVDHLVADVDLLVGRADAERLLGHAQRGAPDRRYRSAVFGRLDGWPLPIEVMADFELFADSVWRPVRFAERVPMVVEGAVLFVPGRCELAAWLTVIGRPKDVARAAALAS